MADRISWFGKEEWEEKKEKKKEKKEKIERKTEKKSGERKKQDENLILTGCLVQTKDGQDKGKVLIHVSNSISLFKNN